MTELEYKLIERIRESGDPKKALIIAIETLEKLLEKECSI